MNISSLCLPGSVGLASALFRPFISSHLAPAPVLSIVLGVAREVSFKDIADHVIPLSETL